MIVLAGPNGAGKSTLYATYVAPYFRGPFINADIIQRDELKNSSPEASYEAAAIATARRRDHLEAGLDFVTETVFSHPSKLALIGEAQAHDFHVRLMHIGVEAADISVARVNDRVEEGGHAVPEGKVRERYERSGPLKSKSFASDPLTLRSKAEGIPALLRASGFSPRVWRSITRAKPRGSVAIMVRRARQATLALT